MPEFPRETPLTTAVKVSAGSLLIVAEERTSATVDVRPHGSGGASRELAEQTRVSLDGDTLTVTTPDGLGRLFRRGAVRIEIRVPMGSSARVDTASADVTCQGRWADLAIDTASGDLRVEHATGDATVKTASGDIRLDRVDGRLRIRGASADVSAGRFGGPAEVDLASGDVNIDEVAADLRVKTASGDVRIGTADQGTLQVGTASGDVKVGVRAGTGVWLDLNTVSGTARNGLDMSAAPGGANGHQLSLRVQTISGDIGVHRVG